MVLKILTCQEKAENELLLLLIFTSEYTVDFRKEIL